MLVDLSEAALAMYFGVAEWMFSLEEVRKAFHKSRSSVSGQQRLK
jgi:hypothetical protein